MKINCIILKSELEFRKFIIENINNISKLYITEDTLDRTIFFYCFLLDNTLIATKESLIKDFYYYNKIYQKLNLELKLNANIETNSKTFILKKERI